MLERRTRPPRGEIDEAALALLARHGAQILATARRYAVNHEDAEDAYQRALEILLTKAPTTREEELVPWLKTVVKHEAFALRRQRDRLTPVTGDGEPIERTSATATTHEQAERYERLSQGAEALRRLKPQEIRCLVLRAQGLSYREICETTGFTYTKVNRCLTEGRQALTTRLAGIEEGIECDRLAPQLSALADGEADAEALALLRPHLKTCLSCRARLREFRAAPESVAALVPAAALAAQPKADSLLQTLLHTANAKTAALAERAQTTAELVTGQKVAALAASAAALAGGGTAADQLANHHGPPRAPAAAQVAPPPTESTDAPAPPPPSPPPLAPEQQATTGATAPAEPPPPPPDPANEFEVGAAAARSVEPEASAAAPEPTGPSPTPSARPSPASAVPTSAEFAP